MEAIRFTDTTLHMEKNDTANWHCGFVDYSTARPQLHCAMCRLRRLKKPNLELAKVSAVATLLTITTSERSCNGHHSVQGQAYSGPAPSAMARRVTILDLCQCASAADSAQALVDARNVDLSLAGYHPPLYIAEAVSQRSCVFHDHTRQDPDANW